MKRLMATTAVGCLATLFSVGATPASAATVGCDPAALVTALAGPSALNGNGTVTLTAGCTYTMTAVNNTTDGPNAFPDILGTVTVIGNGATITRSAAGATPPFRFFLVDDGGSLNISNVTLSNGSIASGDLHGGGAVLNRSTLTATGVVFANNTSMGSTGGGAIDNHDAGQLTVDSSTFTGNSALQGGGIEDEATLCHTSTPTCGMATVTNSTFTNNTTSSFGGGGFEAQLDNSGTGIPPVCTGSFPWPVVPCQEAGGAHDTLVGDTLSGNTSVTEGGGIASFGTMTLTNSTVYSNSTGASGGGGIQNTGTIAITQSTIAANTSAFGANLHTFTDVNQPGPPVTTVGMTIVANGVTGANCSGNAISDNGYNLDSANSCGFTINPLINTDPKLGPLASNGGPTETMALQSGSPAIDAIPSTFAGCTGTDQRGVSRPQGAGCEIGAFEVDTTAPSVPTGLHASSTTKPSVVLTWGASTDNVGVTGYDVYRDGSGTPLATVSGSTLTYEDTTVHSLSTYTYTVDAFDGAGNHSTQSSPVSATTPYVWTSLGGILTSAAAVASSGTNRTDVFVRGTDNALYQRTWNGTSWSPWTSLGGVLTSSPSAISWGPNRIDVFVRGTDNGLWQRTWNGTSWSPWVALGGILTSGPGTASWAAGHLDVFVRGTDNGLWQRTWNGTSWSPWVALGGILTSDPTAVSWGSNRIDVFVRGTDNGLWQRSWTGSSWSAWQSHGGVLTSGIGAASCTSGHLDVYVLGSDAAIYHMAYNGTWSTWQRQSGTWTASPSAVCVPGSSIVSLFERGTDHALWQSNQSGT
jgi:hypothetical protein